MADAFRPLSLLLGAVCLWALCLLILALSGLGSQFPAAFAATAARPVAAVSLVRSKSRLGPIAEYLVVGERPLMNQDRRPSAQIAADGDAGNADLDVMLTSVLITPTLQLAILTDNKDASTRRVRVGETIVGSSWRLVQLEPRRAVVEGPPGQRVLDLRVFNGQGGAPPSSSTAVSAQPGKVVVYDDGNAIANANASTDANTAGSSEPVPPPPAATTSAGSETVNKTTAAIAPTLAPATDGAGTLNPDQQVEAIRRRIEARRAQMRAEADSANPQKK